ncbi:hypothetical protein [Rhodoglobus sp.]
MTNPMDVTASVALEFQAQQLRMISERLSYVRSLLPKHGINWRGPAQQVFDSGVQELHRDLASACTMIETAEQRTMNALSQMSARVG